MLGPESLLACFKHLYIWKAKGVLSLTPGRRDPLSVQPTEDRVHYRLQSTQLGATPPPPILIHPLTNTLTHPSTHQEIQELEIRAQVEADSLHLYKSGFKAYNSRSEKLLQPMYASTTPAAAGRFCIICGFSQLCCI